MKGAARASPPSHPPPSGTNAIIMFTEAYFSCLHPKTLPEIVRQKADFSREVDSVRQLAASDAERAREGAAAELDRVRQSAAAEVARLAEVAAALRSDGLAAVEGLRAEHARHVEALKVI